MQKELIWYCEDDFLFAGVKGTNETPGEYESYGMYNSRGDYYDIFDIKGNRVFPLDMHGTGKENELLTGYSKGKSAYVDLKGNYIEAFEGKKIIKINGEFIFEYDEKKGIINQVNDKGVVVKNITSEGYVLYNSKDSIDLTVTDNFSVVKNRYLLIFPNDIYVARYVTGDETKDYYNISVYDFKTGEITETPYHYISRFYGDRAVVKKLNEKNEVIMNLIDKDFNEIFEEDVASLRFCGNKKYVVAGDKTEKQGLYNINGKEIYPKNYDYIDINNDEILFIKEKNTNSLFNRSLYRGYIMNLKNEILFSFSDVDNCFMVNDFIIRSDMCEDDEDFYESNTYHEILYYDKNSSNLITLARPDFIIYQRENKTFLPYPIIYIINDKHYLLRVND